MRHVNNPVKSQAEHYTELLEERKENPCTLAEQEGQFAEQPGPAPKPTRPHEEWLIGKLHDPKRAFDYLKVAFEDSPEMFISALDDVIKARAVCQYCETTLVPCDGTIICPRCGDGPAPEKEEK
jgi:hypothetical protein